MTKNFEAYDQRSKKILSEASVISNILYYCIPEYKGLSKKEILKYIDGYDGSKYIKCLSNEDNKIDDAQIKYDILFTSKIPNSNDKIGLYINLEAQNHFNPGYDLLNRAIYYSARLISRQKGEAFINSQYDKLKKVYSIWICTTPNKEELDTINYYSLNEECIKGNYHTKKDYKLINIIMLNIGNNYNFYDPKDELLKMLALLFTKTELDSKKTTELLKTRYDILKTEKEVSKMCTLGEGLYYQGRLDGIEEGKLAGIRQGIKQGITQGKLEGIKQGKLEGIEQGIQEGQLSLILNQVKNHIISKEDAFKSINDDNLKEILIEKLKEEI